MSNTNRDDVLSAKTIVYQTNYEDLQISHTLLRVAGVAILLALFTAFPKNASAVPAAEVKLPFSYQFSVSGTLDEAETAAQSWSPYWWVSSGARLTIADGTARTLSGTLASNNHWRTAYAWANPAATDNGYRPQNVFRMFLRSQDQNVSEEIYVRKTSDNLSNAENRDPWIGTSLLFRYVNDNNFYYAGIRADGGVVIKKRSNGAYQTLAYKKVFPGTYNAQTAPSLIPKNEWIGIKAVIANTAAGYPKISLYLDRGKTGVWQLAAEAVDDGVKFGAPISAAGLVGIQNDFADAEFDDFLLKSAAAAAVGTSPAPTPAPTPTPTPEPTPAPTSALFSDTFSQYSDGLITNEYAYWNASDPNARHSPIWEMTSGSLFASGGAGWSGVPNGGAPNALSSPGNNSAIFRLTTKQSNFGDVSVSFDLLNSGLTSTASTPAVAWDGVHVFLRYQSEEHLYYATINRRDNTVTVKKKVPGGPSNGGTYYTLASAPHSVPYGSWQKVKATIKNNTDGSVSIGLYSGDKLILTAKDAGAHGAPIRTPGKVGIRGDNANFKFKNFTVLPQ